MPKYEYLDRNDKCPVVGCFCYTTAATLDGEMVSLNCHMREPYCALVDRDRLPCALYAGIPLAENFLYKEPA